MKSQKEKKNGGFKTYFQDPKAVIHTTQVVSYLSCVFIIIGAVRAIIGIRQIFGILVLIPYNQTNVHHVGEYDHLALIEGIVNLFIVALILLRIHAMKPSKPKFGLYGLELFVLGSVSLIFGALFGVIILLFGILLLMIFEPSTNKESLEEGNGLKEEEEPLLEKIKFYFIINRISIIAFLFAITGVLLFFLGGGSILFLLPFEILSLRLAKYERKRNPNSFESLAFFFAIIYFVLVVFDIIRMGPPGGLGAI